MATYLRIILVVTATLLLSLVSVRRLMAAEEEVDRSTPRRAVTSYVEAAEVGDWARASTMFDLRLVPAESRAEKGPELARQLHRILERRVWLELGELSDDPSGRPQDGADIEQIAAVPTEANGRAVPIVLARAKRGEHMEWLFSSSTVARIPKLYEAEAPSWLETKIPEKGLLRAKVFSVALWQWLGLIVAIGFATIVGRALVFGVGKVLRSVVKHTSAKWDDDLVHAIRPPARFLVVLMVLQILLDPLALDAAPAHVVGRIAGIIAIGAIGWLAVRIIHLLSFFIEQRAKDAALDDVGELSAELRARGITTQVHM